MRDTPDPLESPDKPRPARPAGGVETEWGTAWVMKNCILPQDLLYDVDHDFWARSSADGLVRIGLTDIGQTAGGKLQAVSFPKVQHRLGMRLLPTRTVAVLESAKWLGPVRLPVPGVLTQVNHELADHPVWVNLEPYGRGWIFEFRPEAGLPWLAGEDARLAYAQRLRRTFRSVAGVNDDFWCVHCNDWDDL